MSKTAKRRSEIVRQLADLSRDGWANARPEDYRELEAELHDLDEYRRDQEDRNPCAETYDY